MATRNIGGSARLDVPCRMITSTVAAENGKREVFAVASVLVFWGPGCDGFNYGVAPPGSRTVNTDPLPGWPITVTSPPIMRASLRVMARPRPVPPKRCVVEASAWVNSSNSLACCSAVRPMPVFDRRHTRPFRRVLFSRCFRA